MYRKIAEGTFPCQIKISFSCSGWRDPPSIAGLKARSDIAKQVWSNDRAAF
jgi:hypothetical protein